MEQLGESEAAIGLTAEDAVAIFKQKGDSKRGTLSGQVRSRLDRRARAVCAGLHTHVCVCVCVCVCFQEKKPHTHIQKSTNVYIDACMMEGIFFECAHAPPAPRALPSAPCVTPDLACSTAR